jgi:serine/threonine protein kinase
MSNAEEVREEGCFAVTFERKYYHRDGPFVKRSLWPTEFRNGYRGLHIPRLRKESIRNEAETLKFIRRHTNIPVPTVYCDFEDDDAYYLVTEYIEGISMSELNEYQKEIVCKELRIHLFTLQALKSNKLGGPSGIVIPPYRVLQRTDVDQWNLKQSSQKEYVFCHNDLSQQNVIVDPVTLKINAIIDWEYAGFYPPFFEWPFYNRLGPSVAINNEVDDSAQLVNFLNSQRMDTRSIRVG